MHISERKKNYKWQNILLTIDTSRILDLNQRARFAILQMELAKDAPPEEPDCGESVILCCFILMFLRSATNPGFEIITSFTSTLLLVNISTTSDIFGLSLAVSCTQSNPTLRNFMASSTE